MPIADIVTSIYRRTKTNANSYSASDMLIDINNAYNHVGSLILVNDRKWQFDDFNNSDLPIATTAIVSAQQDYSLASSHLTIDRVEIMDSTGNWTELTQIDQQALKRGRKIALEQYKKTPGLPTEYDLVGNSVFLYPIPNYSQAASLKVYFTRGMNLFTSADVIAGTKSPGFNNLFHDLIPLWVAYNYAVENAQPTANGFLAGIQMKEKQIVDFYGLRNRDSRGGFTVSSTNGNYGNISGQLGTRGTDSNK